jgi:aspartate/tyrosine/aromatic aminotransferase
MQCAECRRDLDDVTKAQDSRLFLCGLCHEKERVHWMILLSTDMEEQAYLAKILRVIERAEQSRPKEYGRPVVKEVLRRTVETWNGLVPIA